MKCLFQFFFFEFQAITLCPKVPVYWTNRALCHRKRKYVFLFVCVNYGCKVLTLKLCHFWRWWCIGFGVDFSIMIFILYCMCFMSVCSDWGRVEEDCLKAVQLDHKTVKVSITHFYFFEYAYYLLTCFFFRGLSFNDFIWECS